MVAITRWAVRLHKWLALIVGLQIVLWVAGGLVMSVLPIERVRAEHTIAAPDLRPIALSEILTADAAAQRAGAGSVTGYTLTRWAGLPVYRFDTASGSLMVDAASGQSISPVDEAGVLTAARAGYSGDAPIERVEYLEEPSWEYRHAGPAWRVIFADGEGTRLYVSPSTGEITARRNDTWRIFDFFWMLHIMDYRERENFNHPLLIAMAGLAFSTVLAGLVLLFVRMRRSVLTWRARRRAQAASSRDSPAGRVK